MSNRKRVLVCPPDHYTVVYEINPWMNVRRQPDRELACQQWYDLKSVLETLADTLLIEPVAQAPDMVFTANAGLVLRGCMVLSHFRHPQRRVEEMYFRRWFEKQGLAVVDLPTHLHFEGEGDALHQADTGIIWFGYGFRSDGAVKEHLEHAFPERIVPLKLVAPEYYHLDTCFCPLPGGAVMYYPEAFDADSRLRLYRTIPAAKRIEVAAEDAQAFACNAAVFGRTVVLNRASAGLRERLARLGLRVWQTDVSEFIRAGGAVKCLALSLNDTRQIKEMDHVCT